MAKKTKKRAVAEDSVVRSLNPDARSAVIKARKGDCEGAMVGLYDANPYTQEGMASKGKVLRDFTVAFEEVDSHCVLRGEKRKRSSRSFVSFLNAKTQNYDDVK